MANMRKTRKGECFYKVVGLDRFHEIEDDHYTLHPQKMQVEMRALTPKEFHHMKGHYVSSEPLRWADTLVESGEIEGRRGLMILEIEFPEGTTYLERSFEVEEWYIVEYFVLFDDIKVKRFFTESDFKKKNIKCENVKR